MKDYLGKSKWVNRPLHNKTQTRYLRFRRGPQGKLKTGFSDAIESFDKAMQEKKTIYEKEFGDL